MRLEDLKIVWESLFSFELEENEYVEIIYDNKDKHFGNAVHIILDIDNPNNHTFSFYGKMILESGMPLGSRYGDGKNLKMKTPHKGVKGGKK